MSSASLHDNVTRALNSTYRNNSTLNEIIKDIKDIKFKLNDIEQDLNNKNEQIENIISRHDDDILSINTDLTELSNKIPGLDVESINKLSETVNQLKSHIELD